MFHVKQFAIRLIKIYKAMRHMDASHLSEGNHIVMGNFHSTCK
jgi:hypothetical protein